ncbi:MAG: IS6 family transposase [Acetobacteraceae bacterium]|nr:MAG: IS6 family transposase [Acetobacteraceae bacterium]
MVGTSGPGQSEGMTSDRATYPGYRFPAEIISHAVWLYHVFSLSLRDVELILVERGMAVTHESIRNWCCRFGSKFAAKLRRRRPKPGGTWHLEEVFLRINGVLHYLWRAVDQHGVVLDILVQDRRNGSAAKRLFKCLLAGLKYKPRRLVTNDSRPNGIMILSHPQSRGRVCLFTKQDANALRMAFADGPNIAVPLYAGD